MPSHKQRLRSIHVIAAVAFGVLLTGCVRQNELATLSSGVCNAFPRPEYQIKGKTAYDQKWADETTEAGVAGCHWQRPEARPASLDPMPVKAPVMVAPTAEVVHAPYKKPSLLQRLRARFHHRKTEK